MWTLSHSQQQVPFCLRSRLRVQCGLNHRKYVRRKFVLLLATISSRGSYLWRIPIRRLARAAGWSWWRRGSGRGTTLTQVQVHSGTSTGALWYKYIQVQDNKRGVLKNSSSLCMYRAAQQQESLHSKQANCGRSTTLWWCSVPGFRHGAQLEQYARGLTHFETLLPHSVFAMRYKYSRSCA